MNDKQALFYQSEIKSQKSLNYLIQNKFDEKFFNDYFICSICKNILHIPKECSECERYYCENCYLDFIKSNKSCIYGCTSDSKLAKPHKTVLNFLDNLSFKCKNDCGATVKYSSIESHLVTLCSKMLYCCGNFLCKFSGERADVDNHTKNCEFNDKSCEVCKNPYESTKKHDCAEFFLSKKNHLTEKLNNLSVEYNLKFRELEHLSEYIEKLIKDGKIKL